MELEGLRFEGETTWNDVWQEWHKREGTRADWQQVARKKGWQSWEEWRDAWVSNFGAQIRRWFRYTILNPLKIFGERNYFVSNFQCTGDSCVIREYTTFINDTKIDIWIAMADDTQVEAADSLLSKFEIIE